MRSRGRGSLVALAAVLSLLVAGCGGSEDRRPEGRTVTVEAANGAVTVPVAPQRTISLCLLYTSPSPRD